MNVAPNETVAAKPTPDLDTIANDLAALKQDLATLMADLRDGSVNRARDAANDAAGRVRGAASDAAEKVRGLANDAAGHVSDTAAHLYGQADAGVKALSHEVEERPLTAVLCAFAVGFVASRVLTR